MKRIITAFLCLALAASFVLGMAPTAHAVSAGSPKYGKNYNTSVTLTGNYAQDICAIAKAQKGKSGSSLGFSSAWCDAFVIDCARIANVPVSVIPNTRGCKNLYNAMLNCGGTVTTSPQAGDLVFYYCTICKNYPHVGIYVGSNCTAEGNVGGKVTHSDRTKLYYCDGSKHTSKSDIKSIYVRPNYSGTAAVNVTFSALASKLEVKQNDAVIALRVNKPSGLSLTKYGANLYNAAGTKIGSVSSTPSGSYSSNTYVNMWYTVSSAMKVTLTAGTKYQYEFWATIGGKTYTSAKQTITTPTAVATSSSQVYYNIDFSDAVYKSRILSVNSTDCALVSLATVESYLYGATTTADKNAVYKAVINKNLGTTSGVPRDNAVQSWDALGYATKSYSLQNLYDQLAQGYPVLIHRYKSDSNQHWSVVCGYVGSTTKLEKSGFIVVDIEKGTGKSRLDDWQGSYTLKTIGYRKNGVSIMTMSDDIRFAINFPESVHISGEYHTCYGWVTSPSGLTRVQVYITNLSTNAYILLKDLPLGGEVKDAKIYDIDSSMTFAKWPAGKYCYTVRAWDKDGRIETVNKYFEIRSNWTKTEPQGPVYTLQYNANGGTGSMPSQTLHYSDLFRVAENQFEKENCDFTGWTVFRSSDNTWYTTEETWLTEAQIKAQGVEKKVFSDDTLYTMHRSWVNNANDITFTFYANWKQEEKFQQIIDSIGGLIDSLVDVTAPAPNEEHLHEYSEIVVPATCQEIGYTAHICSCGDTYITDEVPVCDHFFEEWVVIREPDEHQNGLREAKCTVCEAIQTETIHNNPFTDVGEGSRFKTAILWAYYNNITSGKTATTFEPNTTVNRAQAVTFLWRAEGCPEPELTENPFTDVGEKTYYYKAVMWAVENGITSGTTTTTFSPDKLCTRGHIAMFLYNYAGKPEITLNDDRFVDVTPNNRYYKAVMWAIQEEITSGKTANTFGLHQECTRAHVVTFLYKLLGEKKEELTAIYKKGRSLGCVLCQFSSVTVSVLSLTRKRMLWPAKLSP